MKVIEGAAGRDPSPAEREADLAYRIGAAQVAFHEAMVVAGLKDDPLAPLVKVMGDSLSIQHEIHVATVNQIRDVAPGIGQKAALAAHPEAVRLARAHNLRTALIAAGVLVGSTVATGGACFWWGRATASISVTVPFGEVIASCPANAVQVYDGQRMCPAWIALDQAGADRTPARH